MLGFVEWKVLLVPSEAMHEMVELQLDWALCQNQLPLRTSAFSASMNSDAFNRRKEVTTLKFQVDLLPGLNTDIFQHLAQCHPEGLLGFF